MDINHNLIIGCYLCEIFSNIDNYELIYPSSKEDIDKQDYIIIRCEKCDKLLLILRDHTDVITNEMFGRILYVVRKLMKSSVKIDTTDRHCVDHFHCHIDVNIK